MNKKYRPKIKVLPLDFPFDQDEEWWDECVKEEDQISPIFNKDGYYYDRISEKTWLEKNGKAWFYGDKEAFMFTFNMYPFDDLLPQEVVRAIEVLMRNRMAGKVLVNKYHYNIIKKSLRDTYRDAQLCSIKCLKQNKH